MCDLVDTFQAKLDDIIGNIKGVKTYVDDILVLIKDIFSKHKEQLSIIFGKLRAVGLKVNAPKCSFGLKEIPFLNYVITREIVTPDAKKVQGIMDIGRPITMTEYRAIIGMVH